MENLELIGQYQKQWRRILVDTTPVKRLIDDGYLNADYISAVFKEIADQIAPKKNLSINNLRHTATDILEKKGLSDEEIDAALGHCSVKTALPHYKDRSADALAKRLPARTRKGIEVLSETVGDLLC